MGIEGQNATASNPEKGSNNCVCTAWLNHPAHSPAFLGVPEETQDTRLRNKRISIELCDRKPDLSLARGGKPKTHRTSLLSHSAIAKTRTYFWAKSTSAANYCQACLDCQACSPSATNRVLLGSRQKRRAHTSAFRLGFSVSWRRLPHAARAQCDGGDAVGRRRHLPRRTQPHLPARHQRH